MIKIGSSAPPFSLPDQDGKIISLSDYKNKNVVLFFYPKDFTPGCTQEACSFRDKYSEFKRYNAEVIGISSDNAASHSKFATEHRLPYKLLTDTNASVAHLYGVKKTFGLFAGRASFVIDSKDIVRFNFSSQLQADQHIVETLAALKKFALDK